MVVVVGVAAVAYVERRVYGDTDGCGEHLFMCGAVGGLDAIAVAALVGLGAFALLTRRVQRDFMRKARSEPEEMFPEAVHLAPEQGVEDIVQTIFPSLVGARLRKLAPARMTVWLTPAEQVPPQLVVAQAGEGKTSLLIQLTKQLAGRGLIPVPVSLRDVQGFTGFVDLAASEFKATVDGQLASADEGDRIWRWVCASGRLVILADDLQLLNAADRDLLPAYFREAESMSRALVVTSRHDGVTGALEGWKVPFDHMSTDEAATWTRGDRPMAAAHDEVTKRMIERGELNASWYYLDVLRVLREQGLAAQDANELPTSRASIRRWLLATYTDAYVAGILTPGDGLERSEREDVLASIAQASFRAVAHGSVAVLRASSAPLRSAVAADLLRLKREDVAQVRHAILQSYLASLAIDREKRWRKLARNDKRTPEARDALLFFAGSAERQAQAREVVEALLERDRGGDDAISTVVCAAEIACAAEVDEHDAALVKALASVSGSGGTLERRAIVRQLAYIGSHKAIRTLWKLGADGDYSVSWAAARALVGEPHPAGLTHREQARRAARALAPKIEQGIATARTRLQEITAGQREPMDDWHAEIRTLKRLGWTLPVLAVGADDRSILTRFDEVLELFDLKAAHQGADECALPLACPCHDNACARSNLPNTRVLTDQRGPEASISQGLKAAARLVAWDMFGQLDPATLEQLGQRLLNLYGKAQFWYSRLVLLHGMTDLAIAVARDPRLPAGVSEMGHKAKVNVGLAAAKKRCGTVSPNDQEPRRAPEGFEHPFVVEAAQLCSEALKATEAILTDDALMMRNTWIWDDEGVSVGAPGAELAPRALRLLGDAAVLLNLNEKGDDYSIAGEAKDRRLRREFGTCDYLPPCLTGERDRLDLLGKRCDCPFQRCPYPDNVQRAHREISKLFCRQARQRGYGDKPPPWQPGLHQREYRRFWLEMERHAKYAG